MRLIELLEPIDALPSGAVLVVAMDGWTDAGAGGTGAADFLRSRLPNRRIGRLPSDRLYDYRDRRPQLAIDRGRLDRPVWPELTLDLLSPTGGPDLVLLEGAEPDLAWRTLAEDLIDLTSLLGIERHVGLGSVPGPLPHTRPSLLVCTSSSPELLERFGAPHEEMVVPASCQVALEAELARSGVETLGLWVRIPHYVAGPYPEASRQLLERMSAHLGLALDLGELDAEVEASRTRLDLASAASSDVVDHVRQLEALYDEQLAERGSAASGGIAPPITEAELGDGDQLAAEIERFLRGVGGSGGDGPA
jgi:hypothetical protein